MVVDCPQHAQPVAQVEDLRGACSVAFVKTSLARSLGLPEGTEGMVVLEEERGLLRLVTQAGPGQQLSFDPPLRSPCAITADDEALLVVERAPPRIRIVHGSVTRYIGDAVLREPVAVAAHGTKVAVADAALRQVLVFDLAAQANAVVARADGVAPAGVAFDDAGLGFDVPEDTALWEFLRDFTRVHNHVPDVRTIRSHFEASKKPEVVDRLELVAPLKPVYKGDFIKRRALMLP